MSEKGLITNVIPQVTRLTEELLKSKRQLGKAEDRQDLITIYGTLLGGSTSHDFYSGWQRLKG